MSVAIAVSSHVVVSASDLSLVQRCPTKCVCVTDCDVEISTLRRPRSTMAAEP
jgi:hypothetical protein